MKIKGEELIAKWRRAKSVVDNRGLGEIGGIVRHAGYDVLIDGFSVCNFYERGTYLRYYAGNEDSKWKLYDSIGLEPNKYPIKVSDIDPNGEYEIEKQESIAERFEKGLIKCDRFAVYNTNNLVGYFSTFEEADNAARNLCQKLIDSRNNDRDCARYYETKVQNDAQLASERVELRYYPWYNYQNHPHFVSVEPAK